MGNKPPMCWYAKKHIEVTNISNDIIHIRTKSSLYDWVNPMYLDDNRNHIFCVGDVDAVIVELSLNGKTQIHAVLNGKRYIVKSIDEIVYE